MAGTLSALQGLRHGVTSISLCVGDLVLIRYLLGFELLLECVLLLEEIIGTSACLATWQCAGEPVGWLQICTVHILSHNGDRIPACAEQRWV